MRLEKLDVLTCPLIGTTLIEASAGTGKTWAICGLYLRLILERGLAVEQILVVTFTNAAMAELRERIRDRLRQTILALDTLSNGAQIGVSTDPFIGALLTLLLTNHDAATLRQRLDRALGAFDEAAIQTIHGYCQRVLGDAAFSVGQPFEQALGSDQAIQQAVVADFWRSQIVPVQDLGLAQHLAKKLSPSILEAQLRRRLSKPLSTLIWPEEPASLDRIDSERLTMLYGQAQQIWHSTQAEIRTILLQAIAQKQLNGQSYKADKIEQGAVRWTQWFAADCLPWVAPSKECLLWSAQTLKNKTNKSHFGNTPQHPFFDIAQVLIDELDAVEKRHESIRLDLLRNFLTQAPKEVAQRKHEARQASFDDLLIKLHQSLNSDSGNALARYLNTQFPVALIDEFQDTDPLQFDIFRRIYIDLPLKPFQSHDQPSALFLVGDPKQAIYSFRQADLQTYLSARNRVHRQYFLANNQRSTKPLIDAVNAIFSRHTAAFMQAGLDFLPVGYGEKRRGEFIDQRAQSQQAALQCWSLPVENILDKPQAIAVSAQACAREISALLIAAQSGQVHLKGPDGSRIDLQARHIAILVRTNKQGRQMKLALAEFGIAAAELSTGNVFASAEAAELEVLLHAFAEPNRLDRVRAALSTTLTGLDATDIAGLANPQYQSNAFAEDAQIVSTSVDLSIDVWLKRFQVWRQRWLEHGLALAVHQCFTDLAARPRLLRLVDGARRLTNFLHLIELLHVQEQSFGRADPSVLLRWLNQQRTTPSLQDDAAQLRLESDENLVSIVTIHRAKGLEYPLVFCPFIWEGISSVSGKSHLDGIEYPSEQGRCIDFRDPKSALVIAGKQQAKVEQAAEQLRLLYVALTRAVYRCYLVCGPYHSRNTTKESQRALLNWLLAGDLVESAVAWLEQGPDWSLIDQAWQALRVQQSNICIDPISTVLESALAPGFGQQANLAVDHALLSVRHRPAPMYPRWRTDSFSGLLRAMQTRVPHQVAPVQMPETSQFADRDSMAAAIEATDILHFARGVRAGECIHAVFEFSDFCDPSSWDSAIQRALLRHPPIDAETDSAQRLNAQQLRRMLGDVLNTPLILPGDARVFRLAELSLADRISELEFSLSAQRLTAGSLKNCCARHGVILPDLSFLPLAGYLKGFIDLVFRVKHHQSGQRYYLLDWKSNYLGALAKDYDPAALWGVMYRHGYTLQALIYCLALHRYLRSRMADYRPEQHLGGALYVFVRGVRPDWTQPLEDTPLSDNVPGVLYWCPPIALLDELDLLLQGVIRE